MGEISQNTQEATYSIPETFEYLLDEVAKLKGKKRSTSRSQFVNENDVLLRLNEQDRQIAIIRKKIESYHNPDDGVKGDVGPIGLQGNPGPRGLEGHIGISVKGPEGIRGKTGLPGEIGAAGEKGEKGIIGEKGLDGFDGNDGKNGKDGEIKTIHLYKDFPSLWELIKKSFRRK